MLSCLGHVRDTVLTEAPTCLEASDVLPTPQVSASAAVFCAALHPHPLSSSGNKEEVPSLSSQGLIGTSPTSLKSLLRGPLSPTPWLGYGLDSDLF